MPLYKVEHAKKRRRDLLIDEADPFHQPLHDLLLRRCAPEVKKAFQVDISHIDRLLVARYDAEAGWFRRHRDNGGPNVAFRQFALTLNLNTEDYEGGHLVFPEYNSHRYRPPTGGGVIFSASVLHEAMPVTRGTRYVLLTFLHNEEAEAQRLANSRRICVPQIPSPPFRGEREGPDAKRRDGEVGRAACTENPPPHPDPLRPPGGEGGTCRGAAMTPAPTEPVPAARGASGPRRTAENRGRGRGGAPGGCGWSR